MPATVAGEKPIHRQGGQPFHSVGQNCPGMKGLIGENIQFPPPLIPVQSVPGEQIALLQMIDPMAGGMPRSRPGDDAGRNDHSGLRAGPIGG